MKKLLVGLAIGGLLALAVVPVSGQRGDLYGARALQSLEQAFKTTGVLTFPNYAVAPVTCNAANRGVYYYDTTTGQALVCGAAGWVSSGVTVGTANTIPKWNATPDDLTDSLFLELGVPAAGADGDVLAYPVTLEIMDGAVAPQVISILDIPVTNVNHTDAGQGNTINAINIPALAGTGQDAQAAEIAISIGNGWDQGILAPSGLVGTPAYSFAADTDTGMYFSVAAVNFAVDGTREAFITDDTLRVIGTGTAAFTALAVGNDGNTGFYAIGADNLGFSAGGALYLDIHGEAARVSNIDIAGTVLDIDEGITAGVTMSPTLTANDHANDQRNVLLIDIDIPNGSAGLVNAINIDAVTDDVNSLDSAIMVEGGWDSALTIFNRNAVASANPLTDSIWIFLDDSADYSGGGGNDCAIVAREAGGTNVAMAIMVLNGACN